MKLSIVVAVYNTSKYLHQCLDSIFAQTLPQEEYEVIIVNDCSTDNSIDIINEYADKYSNVVVVDKKVNEATFWSRVDGIIRTKGDYVGFVDSDDWIAPNMYEIMIEKAEKSGADIIQCGTIYEYEDGSSRIREGREDKIYTATEYMDYYANNPTQVALYLRILNRKVVDTFVNDMYPYFNEKRESYRGIRNEDDLLWPLMLSAADSMMYIQESLCHHRADSEGSTMDIIRKNPGKVVDAAIFRVGAGFDVMHFTKDKTQMFAIIEHKQINVIFGLLGRLIETQYYPKDKSAQLIKDSIRRFSKEKKNLAFKDWLRFMHLKLKAVLCYGL